MGAHCERAPRNLHSRIDSTVILQKSSEDIDVFFKIRHLRNPSVVALGDSSVFGVGDFGDAIPAVGAGWVGRFAHDVRASKFLNVAKNGARARDLLKYQVDAALAFSPDIALICIGTNDILRGNFSQGEIHRSLVALIHALEECGTALIFLGLPDPMISAPGPIRLRRILSRRVDILNTILAELEVYENVRFVDTWRKLTSQDSRIWHIDRMHPSPFGHQLIADLVRNNLLITCKAKKRLPVECDRGKKNELFWLLTNGLKWFLKRSVDLIPALIWLMISEHLRNKKNSRTT